MTDLIFSRQGRNRATLAGLLLFWGLLAAAWWGVGAALPILIFFALFTLPALLDLIRNPVATLSLTDRGLRWQNQRQTIDLPLARIAHVRLDTRWDFSVRATVYLHDGTKMRLPQDCMPPHRAFEAALADHGVASERHHFTVF